MDLIYRQGRMFKINDEKLPQTARKMDIKNKLFVALFREFQGASVNDKYKDLTIQQRIEKLNDYAKDWLIQQGHK